MMRPGTPSQHYMADHQRMSGYEAMMPQNQGVANSLDGIVTSGTTPAAMSKVYAEPQGETATLKQMQDIGLNAQGAANYAQNAVIAQAKQASLEDSDRQHKVQTGLNTLMSNIIEHDPRMKTHGEYLTALGAEMNGPNGAEFKQRIANGRLA